jgi:ATP-binding cassette subfamily F protein uup
VNLGIRGMESMDLRSYLELFLFDPHKQRQKVGSLSGGERARVALAKVLREGANLLVFDEPTNDLDLPTLSALEEMLTNYDGSCIVVTHDRAFLDRTATAILAFEPSPGGGPAKVTRYAGGYEDYIAQRGKRPTTPPPAAPPPPAAATVAKKAPKAKSDLTFAERRELETIVEAVDAADRRVTELEAKLADPTLYAKRAHEVAPLQEQLTGARAEATRLAKRWELLESKK